VGARNDPLEAEADQVARTIVGPEPQLEAPMTLAARGGRTPRRAESGAATSKDIPVSGNTAQAIADLPSGGAVLPRAERDYFEPRLGRDLNDVRLHTGPAAKDLTNHLGARAFAVGGDIVFGEGEFAPGTLAGRRLLAHELAHVAQSGSAPPLASSGPPVVRRQPDDADDPAIAAEFEDELQTNEKNADQDGDRMLRAYSSRVALLLGQPHAALHSEDDLSAVMDHAYETAKTEIDTLNALGAASEWGMLLRPYGFPLTWSGRIKDALTLGIDSLSVIRELLQATTDFVTLSMGLSATILADGLPIPMSEIDRLSGFRLRLSDGGLEHGGPISEFARATIRYMQLRYFATFAITWESEVAQLAEDVADGTLIVDRADWKAFVDNKQQILRELPARAMQALATSEEGAQQIESDTVSVADAAVGLGLSSALLGLLGGILGGWQLGADLFDAQMKIANEAVASAGDGERLVMALRWAGSNGYFGAAASGFVDGLIANGPKILAVMAGIVIAQFIPGVDVLLDIYLYFTAARDVIRLIDQLGSAMSAAMNASSVVALQQASASLAKVLTEGGIQILIVLGTMGIGGAVAKLKGRAAELRELEPGLSQSEAEQRALKDLSEADRAPLERAQEVEASGWKDSLSKADQEFLARPENAATRKMWEEMNPIVRRILTRCGSPCIPRNATPGQAAQIEALIDKLGVKDDLIDPMREYFHSRRDVLQGAIDDLGGAGGLEELEALVHRDPVVPGGVDADMALRIGEFTQRLKLSQADQAMLREYLQVRGGDVDAAMTAIEGVRDSRQLAKMLREEAAARTPSTAGAAAIPKGGGDYAHAIKEHGADLDPQHLTSRALTKPVRGGAAKVGLPQGQWYNNGLIVDAANFPRPASVANVGGRLVYEIDMGRPVGRVYVPDSATGTVLVVSDVQTVKVILNSDGSFFNAFPIVPEGAY
jgi:hypothetical protein